MVKLNIRYIFLKCYSNISHLILFTLITILFSGCGLDKNVEKSNSNMEKTNSTIEETDANLKNTTKELKEIRGMIKDLVTLIAETIASDAGTNGKLKKLTEQMESVIIITKTLNKMSNGREKEFEKLYALLKKVMKKLNDSLNMVLTLKGCFIKVIDYDFATPDDPKTDIELTNLGINVKDLEIVSGKQTINGQSYYVITKNIEHLFHKNLDKKEFIANPNADNQLCQGIESTFKIYKGRLIETGIEFGKKVKEKFNDLATGFYQEGTGAEEDISIDQPYEEETDTLQPIKKKNNQVALHSNVFLSGWNKFFSEWKASGKTIGFQKKHFNNIYSFLLNDKKTFNQYIRFNNTEMQDIMEEIRDGFIEKTINRIYVYQYFKKETCDIHELKGNLDSWLTDKLAKTSLAEVDFYSWTNRQLKATCQAFHYFYRKRNFTFNGKLSNHYNGQSNIFRKFLAYSFNYFFSLSIQKNDQEPTTISYKKNVSTYDIPHSILNKTSYFKNLSEIKAVSVKSLENSLFKFIQDSFALYTQHAQIDNPLKLDNIDPYKFPYVGSYNLALDAKKLKQELKALEIVFENKSYEDIKKLVVEDIRNFESRTISTGINRIFNNLKKNNYNQQYNKFIENIHTKSSNYETRTNLASYIINIPTKHIRSVLRKQKVDTHSKRLLKNLLSKGMNIIKKLFAETYHNRDEIHLRVLTLNAKLLYQKPMADKNVFKNALNIANAIKKLNPSPDIILLQEVFPRDTHHIDLKTKKFRWPNSKDLKKNITKDMKTIHQVLGLDIFHPPVVAQKQVGGKYKTITDIISNFIDGKSIVETLKDDPYNGLNLGPSGLVIFVKKKVTGIQKRSFSFLPLPSKSLTLNTKVSGSYFSRSNRGAFFNRLIPISRGKLTTLVSIEDDDGNEFGNLDVSTTHLTTDVNNNIQRIMQIAQMINEFRGRNFKSKAYTINELRRFRKFICTTHFGNSNQNTICLKKAPQSSSEILDQIYQLADDKPEIINNSQLKDIEHFFRNIEDTNFQNNHMLSIFGGDFNLEPYGQELVPPKKRVISQWPYQLLTHDRMWNFAHPTAGDLGKIITTDYRYNPYNDGGNDSISGVLKSMALKIMTKLIPDLEIKMQSNSQIKKFVNRLQKIANYDQTQLDYLGINEQTSNQQASKKYLSYIRNVQAVFKRQEAVSDHYGVLMDLTIIKSH